MDRYLSQSAQRHADEAVSGRGAQEGYEIVEHTFGVRGAARVGVSV